jgi:hypothetical protein
MRTLMAFLVLEAMGVLVAWKYSIAPAIASHRAIESLVSVRRGDCEGFLLQLDQIDPHQELYLKDQIYVMVAALESMKRCPGYPEILRRSRVLFEEEFSRHRDHYLIKEESRLKRANSKCPEEH